MALNYVDLVLDLYDAAGNPLSTGYMRLAPTEELAAAADHEDIPEGPVQVILSPDMTLPATVTLLATDNADVTPSGWKWGITYFGIAGDPPAASFALPYNGGATAYLSAVL